jgi:hypothetical protein
MLKHLVLLAVLLALCALSLVACGGGGSKSSSAAQTPATAAPEATRLPATAASTPFSNATSAATAAAPTSAPSSGGGPAGDACGLLTKADVTGALGNSMQDGKLASTPPQQVSPGLTLVATACNFDSPSSPLTVTVYRGSGSSLPQIRQTVEQIICARKEQISGIGDGACWYSADHTELQFLKGSALVDISISQYQGPDRVQVLTDLAKKAAARL